jgi:hypothetical protein
MTTKLYLVQYEDGDGDDMALFVEARNPREAALLWRQHYDYTSDVKPEMVIEAPTLTGKPCRVTWQALNFHVGWSL